MKRSTLLASTAALLLSAGVAVAAGEAANQQPAHDMPPPPHGDRPKPHHSDKMRNKFKRDSLPRGFDELGLSEAQKNKIRDIMAQYRPRQPENTPARHAEFQQKMAQRQSQEQQLLNSKNFDEQAARKLITERQQERAELERQHAERELQMLQAHHAAFQVLTPAQRQKYTELQKQQHQRFAERMARRQPPQAPTANK